MAVGTEQHFAAAGHHLARVLVNDCLICRYVIAAVFDCRGQTEDVVVFVDRAADGAEAVMTVRQHIGDREAGQTARSCRLDDADVGDIVRNQTVEGDMQLSVVRRMIVCGENFCGNGFLLRAGLRCDGGDGFAALNRYAVVK